MKIENFLEETYNKFKDKIQLIYYVGSSVIPFLNSSRDKDIKIIVNTAEDELEISRYLRAFKHMEDLYFDYHVDTEATMKQLANIKYFPIWECSKFFTEISYKTFHIGSAPLIEKSIILENKQDSYNQIRDQYEAIVSNTFSANKHFYYIILNLLILKYEYNIIDEISNTEIAMVQKAHDRQLVEADLTYIESLFAEVATII